MNRLFASLAVAFLFTGCGGIPDSKLLVDLDEDDVVNLCDEFAETPSRTVTCDFGGTEVDIEVGLFSDAAECNADYEPPPDGCGATVGDVRDCLGEFSAITDEEVCDPESTTETPAACQNFLSCFET